MNRKRTFLLTVLVSAFATSVAAAEGGDAQAGRNKAAMCMGCHGIEGYHTAYPEVYRVPRLGHQHSAYIVKALQSYKSGSRKNETMRAIAASLTEKDMNDLAAYYSAAATVTAATK
jgi:cytochrome c553